jgi:signal transduction histidine kinase
MHVQHEPSQGSNASQAEIIQKLQRRVEELTTENLALSEQLARKEQFTAMIVHELRGPLSPIINYAQLLSRHSCNTAEGSAEQRNITRPGSIQRGTSIIIGQAKRLNRLVNDLLDSYRLSSSGFNLVRANCDLVQLVQEVVDSIRPVAPYHTFVVMLPDEPVIGNWDRERLQQVVGNLLDNAVKYSDEKTTVTIHVWTTSGQAHVSVHNHGSSIPSADIELLFQPYSRLKAAGARQGLGLGLYIAYSIIEAHGGKLRLEPHNGKTPKGTTFSFDLPL